MAYKAVVETERTIMCIEKEDNAYPKYLKEIDRSPQKLFIKGDLTSLDQPMLAIVGSRKCTEYGFSVARKLARELAEKGFVIVSGMARGIDEAAHKGALEAGRTIGVLGTGVDICYPAQNKGLYHQIQHVGCVLSEFDPGTQARPYHFPMRNRIISGLCLGVIVVEAEARSGSLITAQLALEQNREVFAVPGNIYSVFSEGTNKLIQAGAKLVMSIDDILCEFPQNALQNLQLCSNNLVNNKSIPLDKVEIMVYDCLSWQPIQIETINGALAHQNINLSIQSLEMILLQLEIKGVVQRLPARRYSRTK